jgi:hypothetical protein
MSAFYIICCHQPAAVCIGGYQQSPAKQYSTAVNPALNKTASVVGAVFFEPPLSQSSLSSNNAIDSTCAVCGNACLPRTAFSLKPCGAQLACVPHLWGCRKQTIRLRFLGHVVCALTGYDFQRARHRRADQSAFCSRPGCVAWRRFLITVPQINSREKNWAFNQ